MKTRSDIEMEIGSLDRRIAYNQKQARDLVEMRGLENPELPNLLREIRDLKRDQRQLRWVIEPE